ncbi:MAG: TetR/AcrR family transcriptional regulator [Candidatus Kariarchaeaceae archaeon]|jgi:AcrR family transcriptional regulator
MSESKLRILDVAAQQFMNRGYEIVTLKELAEILEIKAPSLYYHFPGGKEAIYVEVVERTLDHLHTDLMIIISTTPDLRECMISIGKWAEKNMIMSPVVMNRIDMPQLSLDNQRKLAMSSANKLFSPIREMFYDAQKRGILRDIDPEVVSGMFLAMLEAMDERINMRVPDKLATWAKSVDILLHGIMKDN